MIWPVTLELKKTPCENQRTPSFMSVWVIPLERMTFQKYSWCSKILQFDVRLIFREHSYSLHHKNKHWNFILLIFHQRGKLWVNYTNMRKKKNQSKSSKWQPNHNFCKQNSQLSNEPNILWDVVKHTVKYLCPGRLFLTIIYSSLYLTSTVDQYLTLDSPIACFYSSDRFPICNNGLYRNFFKNFDS